MAILLADLAKDQALDYIRNNANLQVMCRGAPASYAAATTDLGLGGVALGEVVMAPGDFSIADGDVDGRKLLVAQKAGVTVDVTGRWDHVALVDTVNLDLLAIVALEVDEGGMAQAGGASDITLRAIANAADDAYNGQTIEIVGGTAAGQVAEITDYVGATKVATVAPAWPVQPDATSVYEVYGQTATNGQLMTIVGYDVTLRDAVAA